MRIVAAAVATLLLFLDLQPATAEPPTAAAIAPQESSTDLPPDLPLPASPRLNEDWLREANILQP